MAVDWSAKLREQSRFAKRMVGDVPTALSDPHLSEEDARQLFQTIENCALSFDAIIEEMHRIGAETQHMRAASTIAAVWLDLMRLAAERLRGLQQPGRRRASF